MRSVVWKMILSLVIVWGCISSQSAFAAADVTVSGQRVAAVGDTVQYAVMITGISGGGMASLRFGSPPGGLIQGIPQLVPFGVGSWMGLFPMQFGNITPYPIESTIHATFTDSVDGWEVDSASFRVTVLPVGWSPPAGNLVSTSNP